ncbi:MAG: hypothetical protein H6935_05500 [Thiobacillus sp.]|nr:hypothetical protein [Thiobacillus sp.]
MRRKAMLMGMAVIAGMPGWAMAKGSARPAAEAASSGSGAQARDDLIEIDRFGPQSDQADATADKAAEALARIKSMLRGVNYGAVRKPGDDGWAMELLERGAVDLRGGDARLEDAKPFGVAFRRKF